MEAEGIKRFLYLSADAVKASREDVNPVRKVLLSVILHNPTADHELNESMIPAKLSGLDDRTPAQVDKRSAYRKIP